MAKITTDIILYLFDKMYTFNLKLEVIRCANYLGFKIAYKLFFGFFFFFSSHNSLLNSFTLMRVQCRWASISIGI